MDGKAMDEGQVLEGRVVEILPNALYRVALKDGHEILAHVSSRTRMYMVKLLPGERVTVKVTPFDPNRGRIVHRAK
jgi:translation initiation factor IF-1